jgi:hypothetical protein
MVEVQAVRPDGRHLTTGNVAEGRLKRDSEGVPEGRLNIVQSIQSACRI